MLLPDENADKAAERNEKVVRTDDKRSRLHALARDLDR